MTDSERSLTHKKYVYTFACHENERELCTLELSTMFGLDSAAHLDSRSYVRSNINVPPGRSPFIHGRLDVLSEADTVNDLLPAAARIHLLPEQTFKVVCLKEGDHMPDYDRSRQLEREVGMCIRGKAQMKQPKVTFGLIKTGEKWILGQWTVADRSWQSHQQKPQNYSTGLGVTLARALVNIAIPKVENHRLLDPCCGMGTVVIEALSMGIETRGNDLNPLAVQGARINLPHYGYDPACITLRDMNELDGTYDAAILDMPYNLCSVLPDEEQRRMLTSLRRLTKRAIVVSTEWVEEHLLAAGWEVNQYCTVRKGTFIRHIWLCT
ncbi:TRM11 family SAM-dependent methyltransferase [Paenibacillus xylanilyticus]|uniref:TRM11 family SAM-dependent methyltransferase n=1 Tax=Paenibacillus xylanilyticus TaxID=248903 RepID=UPI001FE8712D|nr:RNA methyltransferase [Paenibacillus xylanilyticus]